MHVRHRDLQATLPYRVLWFPWSTEKIRWSQTKRRNGNQNHFGSRWWAGHSLQTSSKQLSLHLPLTQQPYMAKPRGQCGLGRNEPNIESKCRTGYTLQNRNRFNIHTSFSVTPYPYMYVFRNNWGSHFPANQSHSGICCPVRLSLQ